MNIRRIERDDFEFVYHSLCDLENEILDREALQKIFCENIDNPSYSYLIAEIKNEKIGFITLHTQNLLHHCGLVGEIQEFYITEHFRGKGIGRQLIRRIMDLAEENKLKSIEVATNKKRIENINIYENLGFNLTHNKFTIYK
ncbi:GNAT family N-acetyltransferase [Chryseobacterium sp. ISL-6]|uniref:GNAT family N-acetyltransferase n=1 Tax=Chryseobacterium sp. ISL-6 TaxID=2819143 RepID=UPI0020355EDF|nr:GNAT family N-acetyltransferase [Chryseobacterium sp. ISL-6]